MTIKTIALPTGETVPALGQGTWYMGDSGHKRAAEVRALQLGLDLGLTLIDTAEMYADGGAEEVTGAAIKGRRDGAFIVSKVLPSHGSRTAVIGACEASLKRLGVDVIDLYYQHRVDPNVAIEETVGAMAELVKAGKVKALGLSEANPETIKRAHKTHPIAAVQSEYSLLYRKDAEETLATTRALGISFVAYSPLGRSLLTGSVKQASDIPEGDGRGRHPRFSGDNLARNLSLVNTIEAMAKAKGCTPGQVALAWLLAQGTDIVPIPGTKQAARVDQNLAALDVTLSAAEVAQLSAALPPGAAAGTRYAEAQMKAVYL